MALIFVKVNVKRENTNLHNSAQLAAIGVLKVPIDFWSCSLASGGGPVSVLQAEGIVVETSKKTHFDTFFVHHKVFRRG